MATTPDGSLPRTGCGTTATKAPDIAADANALRDEAKSAAGKVIDEARDQVDSLADRAKQELGSATDKAKSLASDQKDLLADQVGGVAEAIGKAASDLEQSKGPSAQYARMIADSAENLSSAIRDNDVDQLLDMAQDFGRRQPVAFIGAAALLGFAASRFVMASAKRSEDQRVSAEAGAMGSTGYQEYPGEPATTSVSGSDSRGTTPELRNRAGGYDVAR